jgi:hypothetical protein
MLQIQTSGEEIIILNLRSNCLDAKEQRYVIAWLWNNKPDMIRDIVCEECPEHTRELLGQ